LRVPRVLRYADVVPDGLEGGIVKLDCRIYAVIGAAVRSAGRSSRSRIEGNPSGGGFGTSGRGAGKPVIIEGDADRVSDAVIRDVQVGLEIEPPTREFSVRTPT
jgi:hypothetical protein